ncbi:MAG: hypothetical protein ACI8W8_004993 [Rhodothermales bacterium]|jgi:hypothetical protein
MVPRYLAKFAAGAYRSQRTKSALHGEAVVSLSWNEGRMLNRLMQRLFGSDGATVDSLPAAKVVPDKTVRNVPKLEKPILLFMESTGLVETIERVPSWQTVHVKNREDCARLIEGNDFSVFIALSPIEGSGQAGQMISLFQSRNPHALTVYHGWHYNLDITFQRALKAGADLAIVGGVTEANLIYFLGTGILLKSTANLQQSAKLYRAVLEKTCADSGFWSTQGIACPARDVH